MKCQNLISGRKNIVSLSSAVLAKGMVKIKTFVHICFLPKIGFDISFRLSPPNL